MKIAIIGTGNVGSALGGSFARAGHDVTLAGQDAEKARATAAQIGAVAADTPLEAVAEADIVVLAVPFAAAEGIVTSIAPAIAGKVVVDATNPLRPDFSGLATEGGPSAAERIAARAPMARVVKAFNTVFSSIQARPGLAGAVPDGLLAGDDADAKRAVAELVRSIGIRPVDAGSLADARSLEALAWLNISLQLRNGGSWDTAIVLVNAPEKAIAA